MDRAIANTSPAEMVRAVPQLSIGHSHRTPGVAKQDSLVEIVWRRRTIVVAVTAAALLVGVIYCLFAKPYYTATARLFVEPAGADAKLGRDSSDRSSFLFTQREVLSSTPVLAVALGRPGIQELKAFAGQTSPFAYLKTVLDVDVGKKDELVTVSFNASDREDATKVVSAVVDAYAWFQSSQRTASASGTATTLQTAKDNTEAEITQKTRALQAFAVEHNIVISDEQRQSFNGPSIGSIAASLTSAHMDTLNAKAHLDEASRLNGDASPATAPAADVAHLSIEDDGRVLQQLRDAEQYLQSMTRQLGGAHPMVRAVQQRVDQLNASHHAILRLAYAAATKREADLQDFYAAEQHRSIEQHGYASDYARMAGEVARLQLMSDSLDTRIRDLKVNDDGSMASVSILEPAHAGLRPSGPSRIRALAIALVAGLLLGAVSACVGDRLDTRVRSAAEVEEQLGLAVLGVVPPMTGSLKSTDRALTAYYEPDSAYAAACRSLRTAILFGTRISRARTILITSPSRGDGRTTIACNLAASLAQAGNKVLLVDADLRSPALHRIFGVDNTAGLSDVLAPAVFEPATLRTAMYPTSVPDLDLLPSGAVRADGPELFNRHALAELLACVSDQYDHVVIDTPPSRVETDARIIAASCDVTLLVLRSGTNDRQTVARTRSDLSNVGANVVGAVLNEMAATSGMAAWSAIEWRPAAALANHDYGMAPAGRTGGGAVPHAAHLSPSPPASL